MKNFNTQRNKFKYLNNLVQETSQIISNQEDKNAAIKIRINKNIYNYNKKAQNWSSEWETLLYRTNSLTSNIIYNYYYSWSIEFDKFDIRLLSSFDIDILYKSVPEDISWEELYPYDIWKYANISKDIQIEDIDLSEYIKKVKIQVNLWLSGFQSAVVNNYQVKLNCFFINQRNYT